MRLTPARDLHGLRESTDVAYVQPGAAEGSEKKMVNLRMSNSVKAKRQHSLVRQPFLDER
jgi:hypothetical protein